MTNKEKFLQLVSKEKSITLEKVKERIINRPMLRESQKIALKVLSKLDELNWSQKQLAEKMSVSPQYINKIVRGKENLTLETLVKLQEALNIPLLASFSETKKTKSVTLTFQKIPYSITESKESEFLSIKQISIKQTSIFNEEYYKEAY